MIWYDRYMYCIRIEIIISTTKKNKPILQNYSSTSSKTEDAQPDITMPPSPPPTSTAATGSHVRRGQRNDKHNRYSKNQSSTTSNVATPRRPIRTPTSSPLTMSSGLNNFISPRTRLVKWFKQNKTKTKPKKRKTFVEKQTTNGNLKTHIHSHTQPIASQISLGIDMHTYTHRTYRQRLQKKLYCVHTI